MLEILDGQIATHGGRIANTAGDSVLAEFGSVGDAVRCAVRLRLSCERRPTSLALRARHVLFRHGEFMSGDVTIRGRSLLAMA